MNAEEWDELARSFNFSSPRSLLVHWYYTTGIRLQHIVDRIGVSRKEVIQKLVELNLPLREEDKLK